MFEKLKRSLRKRVEAQDDSTRSASLHSRGYHRYFEGYTEATKVNAKGKVKTVRVYTGTYYVQDLTDSKRVLLRIGYVLMFLMAVFLFVVGAIQNVGSNRTWYVVVPEVVAVIGIFWMFCTLFTYVTAPWKLTIHDYATTSGSLKKSSITAAAGLAAATVLTIVYMLIHSESETSMEGFAAMCMFLSAIVCACIFLIERFVISYKEEASHATVPQGGVEIE